MDRRTMTNWLAILGVVIALGAAILPRPMDTAQVATAPTAYP